MTRQIEMSIPKVFEMHASEVFNLPSTYHTTFLLEAGVFV